MGGLMSRAGAYFVFSGLESEHFFHAGSSGNTERRVRISSGFDSRRRPYRYEYTGSLSNSEVNRSRALSVGKWGTVSEAIRVLPAFVFFHVGRPRSRVYRVLCAS